MLRALIVPLFYLFVVTNATYFLPFAKIIYHMHTPVKGAGTNNMGIIAVITENIPVDIFLLPYIGGVSGSNRDLIRLKMVALKTAGNAEERDDEVGDEDAIAGFFSFLNSITMKVAALVNADTDNLKYDGQIEPFVTAATVIIPFMAFGVIISMLSVFIQCAASASEKLPRMLTRDKLVSLAVLFNGALSYLCLVLSIVYPVMTWHRIFGHEGASFGWGYKILLFYSIAGIGAFTEVGRAVCSMGATIRIKRWFQSMVQSQTETKMTAVEDL